MVARLGNQERFAQGQGNLAELARVHLTSNWVARSFEAHGELTLAAIEQQFSAVAANPVVPH